MKLKPVFEAIAKEYPDIKFVKVNVDQDPEIASNYGVLGIPIIKFFCEGKEVGEIVGPSIVFLATFIRVFYLFWRG